MTWSNSNTVRGRVADAIVGPVKRERTSEAECGAAVDGWTGEDDSVLG